VNVSLAAQGTTAPDSRTGTVIGNRYRLQRRLGVGGMGEVYEAKHTEIPRRFAVKLLRAEYARDPEMRARFRQEAQTAAGLSSDHIVEVSDFGYAEDGSPYLVMELLDGVDLRKVLASLGRLSVEQAVAVAKQTCAGAAAAHALGVIHRDLKPENLFLARRGERTTLKVLDFGIAKLRNQSMGTGGGRLLGTPAYMPPEQVRNQANLDQRADVYALGAILYEALTGSIPHPGAAQHEIVSHVLFEQPAPVCALNPAVPSELGTVIHRALASAADDRYQSMAELSHALDPFAGSEMLPLPAASDCASTSLTPPARSSEQRMESQTAAVALETRAVASTLESRVPPPRKARAVVFVAAAALLAVGALWVLASRTRNATASQTRTAATAMRAVPQRNPSAGTVPQSVTPALEHVPAVTNDAHAAPAPLETPLGAVATPPPPGGRARAREGLARVPRHTTAPIQPASADTQPEAGQRSAIIEVRRGERTIVFKRENPLHR
jgi:serine/threonine protein kinase